MKILCWLFDHKWIYSPKRERKCSRCKKLMFFTKGYWVDWNFKLDIPDFLKK